MAVRDVVQAAAGVGGGDNLYVEDVFSTYLYTGTGSTQTITNGIDLDGEGGLVWLKSRSNAYDNWLYDTVRGNTVRLISNTTAAQGFTGANGITSFNTNGFGLGAPFAEINGSGATYASWSFRKAPKFFDIVTWTGNSTAGRQIPHNLGSAPGFVLVKRTSNANNWVGWHRALTNTQYISINSTHQALSDGGIFWNSTTPSATDLTLGNDSAVNGSGSTYVAYLFAHDAGGFGDDGEQNVISCGSFTTDGSGNATVNLGYEPQWVLVKNTGAVEDWILVDDMRGWVVGGNSQYLRPNLSNAESGTALGSPTATGFTFSFNLSATYIYIAIRRGPMKVPTVGTSVYDAKLYTGAGTNPVTISGISMVPDLASNFIRDGNGQGAIWWDRLRGGTVNLEPRSTGSENSQTGATATFDKMTTVTVSGGDVNVSSSPFVNHFFRRAPGFMDVVCYTGDGATPNNVTHNLGVLPELVMVKGRSNAGGWFVWLSSDPTFNYLLSSPDFKTASLRIAGATSSSFAVNNSTDTNTSTYTYVAHLFASLPGVSKVGSYTGTGADLNVDCGFSAGARFILIKRTDSTGDWYVWDSARGIVAGNDPYLLLNSTAAEVTGTDYIDPLSSGFTVTSSTPAALNASGGTYIFLAIA